MRFKKLICVSLFSILILGTSFAQDAGTRAQTLNDIRLNETPGSFLNQVLNASNCKELSVYADRLNTIQNNIATITDTINKLQKALDEAKEKQINFSKFTAIMAFATTAFFVTARYIIRPRLFDRGIITTLNSAGTLSLIGGVFGSVGIALSSDDISHLNDRMDALKTKTNALSLIASKLMQTTIKEKMNSFPGCRIQYVKN